VTGVVLYQVMASFLLPLFLASVLTVIFRPVHQRVSAQLKGRDATAALLTTMIILLTVLAPLGTVITFAVREAFGAVGGGAAGGVALEQVDREINDLRRKFGVEIPFRQLSTPEKAAPLGLADIDSLVRALPDRIISEQPISEEQAEAIAATGAAVQLLRKQISEVAQRVINDDLTWDAARRKPVEYRRTWRMLDRQRVGIADSSLVALIQPLLEMEYTLQRTQQFVAHGMESLDPDPTVDTQANESEADAPADAEGDVDEEPAANERSLVVLDSSNGELSLQTPVNYAELRRRFGRMKATYEAFRIDLLGGPIWAWATDLANPGAAQLEELVAAIQNYLRGWLPSVAGQATAIFGQLILGVCIMTLAMYYFLKDGPAMVITLMKLSPLDDRYELELLTEFDKVSRAVVLATLLSAVAQGVLAGIAYLIAGFNSVFLLTALTIIFALVPFVGAAAIWLPAALWMMLIDDNYVGGVIMMVYGFAIISMVDNLIKPIVLHGQSKLHPLLALLSVLGGVQALGPIGILVGPMIVSFLQALLNILHHELQAFDGESRPVGSHVPNAM
ncbi:MAG: AI-2E family transporter, partial [Planctomycetales bacterium]|nr:AI-2E family transporter [Planctomycetales bacterium]